jgi:hypothetical protein
LRADLDKCIEFLELDMPEKVAEYFWTKSWNEINQKIDVIIQPFSEYQKAGIEEKKAELHKYFISNKKSKWEKKS